MWYLSVIGATLQGRAPNDGNAVDVGHGEIDTGLLRAARICSTVLVEPPMATSRVMAFSKAPKGRDRARQDRSVILFVVAFAQFDSQMACLPGTVACGRHGVATTSTVPRQAEAEGFGQAVHRIGGEHAGTRTAGRAGRTLDFVEVSLRHGRIGGLDHGIHQIEMDHPILQLDLACLHRAAGDENDRDIQAHGGHQHARVILSQLEMQTMASAQWALTMYSTESAIRSRLGSE